MSDPSARGAASKEQLSALVDGELAAPEVAAACADWKQDAELRATWHRYQLIGDVLRSEDLAASAQRDCAFIDALRARLATEPVPLAPAALPAPPPAMPVPATRARRSAWGFGASSAVAAGFMAVAGVLFVTRAPAPAPAAVPLASSDSKPAVVAVAAPQQAVVPAQSVPGNAYVRDPQLDRYLAAHKQLAGRSTLGMPSDYLRNANVEVPGR